MYFLTEKSLERCGEIWKAIWLKPNPQISGKFLKDMTKKLKEEQNKREKGVKK